MPDTGKHPEPAAGRGGMRGVTTVKRMMLSRSPRIANVGRSQRKCNRLRAHRGDAEFVEQVTQHTANTPANNRSRLGGLAVAKEIWCYHPAFLRPSHLCFRWR